PVRLDVALRDLPRRHAFLVPAPDDLVVDVGEVLHELHRVPAVAQVAADHVEHDRAAPVADVAHVVHRDPAHVHPHLAAAGRGQLVLPAGQGVERAHGHQTVSTLTTAMEAI